MIKAHGKISNVMSSSSMSFPKEENVTHQQVKALYDELGLVY